MKIYPVYEHQIEGLISNLKAHDTNVTPNADGSYSISGHGVEATAIFTPDNNELNISVAKKPFYVSMDRIQNGIEEALRGE